ncbi:MAG: hypothetical protein ACI9ON_001592 [Limisphaerales bacterium]|jgi:uncharacterized protein (TIGR01244 family)
MELKMRISALVLCCLFAVTSVAEIKPYDTPQKGELSGVQDFFAQVAPRVWVSGQPNAAAFTELKNMGVATVINLRTSQEMDNRQVVPFDEAQTLAELGIDYVHIPQGGPDTPYSPAALQQVADALGSAEGNILLHCTVAWRASHMWAAYLVAHQGVSVDDAVAIGKQMNMGGYPFAEFLEREVSLR